MREDILENLQNEIYNRCQKQTNKFGMGCYYHIVAVVKNAEILAEKYGADKEIVMIAAWLHDIASITDYSLYELHHIHGAEMAHAILKEYGYDDKKISLVQECIKNHKGSVNFGENIMKKKLCFILIEMIMALVLVCACSTEQKAEEAPESESTSDAPIELTVSEQSDIGTDDAADLTLAPDLNHNGVAEEVRLTDIDDGNGQQLEIWENNERILFRTGYFGSKEVNFGQGSASIFLCTLDGEDYLLRYYPEMYQGVCMYGYELSTLEDNKETRIQWNRVDFDINFGSFNHNDFEPEAIAAFMDEINDLLSHSVQMLNTDSDLLAVFEKEGRLYDSLWWLDDWEPEFIRDESKSLQENLEDFRTALTAVQEPMILEEADGLPITEPLELAFYSGAGAWGTCITLNPDGSFAGDYHDADMNTIYVCQFHGQFGKVEKLTDASWLLTLTELKLDTGHSIGEKWDEADGDYTIHYISSEPYGFDDDDWVALKPGAQFILYSPEATGYEPGTELYGALEFQSWMHKHKEFISADDILDCWGLQNMETGRGFFGD